MCYGIKQTEGIMKKIIILIVTLSLICSCKRSLFEEQSPAVSNTGTEQTIVFENDTQEKLFPENGQAGGMGQAGDGNYFTADVWSDSYGWHTAAELYNISSRTAITGAKIMVYFKTGGNTYRSFLLDQNTEFKGRYHKIRMSVNPVISKQAGFFHIISGDIDFKIGFGIETLSFHGMVLNGSNRDGQIEALTLSRGAPLTIQVSCPAAKYYDVVLFGVGGKFQIKNYYAPMGTISIPGTVTNHYPNSLATVFVTPHTIYLLKKFSSHIYADNNKLVSSVSVRHGRYRGAASFIKFQ